MRAKGIFISTILVIDTFFVSYAVGFNSRQVLVVDPTLAPLTPPPAAGGKAAGRGDDAAAVPAGKKKEPGAAPSAGKKKEQAPAKNSTTADGSRK